MEEKKYYNFNEILKFVGIGYEFDQKSRKYPFNRGVDNVSFSWGQIQFLHDMNKVKIRWKE